MCISVYQGTVFVPGLNRLVVGYIERGLGVKANRPAIPRLEHVAVPELIELRLHSIHQDAGLSAHISDVSSTYRCVSSTNLKRIEHVSQRIKHV